MHRIAVIGAGRMGAAHLRNAAQNPRLEVARLVDPRPDAAELAASVGARLSSLDETLGDAAIEGVVVAASTDTHLALSRAALAAGKAVFCEKPLDLDLATLVAAKAEFAEAKAPLLVGFNRRYDPHFRALAARLHAGEIGALESLHIVNHDPAPPPAHFLPTSGGLFKDFTIHDFDTVAWLAPEPMVEVFAWASCLVDPAIAAAGDVDTARVLLRDASGRLAVISNTRRSGCGYDQRIEAFGSAGMLRAGDFGQDSVEAWTEAGARAAPRHPGFIARYAETYRLEMEHFADVLEGATPAAGYEASVAALALAEAAARSARTGEPVRLEAGA
jgi:myo-inositol 2-dehydrogenase/D-chiro-inositol 1-dehydrogenase